MKVGVNQKLCNTAGICVQLCPEVFRFQEGSKRAKVIVDEVPPQLEGKVAQAINQCPAKAIFPVGK